MIVLANDDGKKMVERDDLGSFLDEYAYITGVELTLVGAGERPDFVCEKRGRLLQSCRTLPPASFALSLWKEHETHALSQRRSLTLE